MIDGGTGEAWVPVKGFPAYQVSDQGRLRRVLSPQGFPRKPHVLKLKRDKDGYSIAVMSVNGIYFYRRMARLVLFAFVGPPTNPNDQASHGNGIPDDDRVSNLRWATPVSNNHDKFRHGTILRGERSPTSKLTERDVRSIRARIADGEGQHALSREMKIPVATIHNIVKRHSWKHIQ